jgi:hypothetical protein
MASTRPRSLAPELRDAAESRPVLEYILLYLLMDAVGKKISLPMTAFDNGSIR